MRDTSKVVALFDWNWVGHHPTYYMQFAAAMAQCGSRVVPFCADPEDFLNRLVHTALPAGVRERIEEPVRVFAPVVSSFRPARWSRHYDALRCFWGHGRRLRRWQVEHGCSVDLVFFACIYDWQFEHFRFAERLFGFSWAGLYLHARSFRMPGCPAPYTGKLPCPEKIFSSPLLRAAAVLDEAAVEPLQKITGGKPVLVFPDVTAQELPPNGLENGLAQKIKAFAEGRPVVSLVGHLQWTKGFDIFMEAAAHPLMKEVFFFLGGDVTWGEISMAERARLTRAFEALPNVYAHMSRIHDESSLNAVVATSDVVVAAYRNFPNSSNVLTKAAVFERPIVVSDGYLMAERVRRYGLGEVIPEGDAGALVAALRRMLQPGYHEHLRGRAKWQDYREAHSLTKLNTAFAELVASL